MYKKLSVNIMNSIRNILKINPPIKTVSPPRFSLETLEKRIRYVESKGNKGGEYPW
jgi:hypothetical protein